MSETGNSPVERGRFVSLHGIDGTGKTVTAEAVHKALQSLGIPSVNYDVYRKSLSSPHEQKQEAAEVNGTLEERISAYLASMSYHSDRITELLNQGYHVVKSRYVNDIMAHFAHLDVPAEKINEFIERFPLVQPDLKVVLVVDESVRRHRIERERGVLDERDKEHKIPGSRLLFFEDYLKARAMQQPATTLSLDTTKIDIDTIAKLIVERLLKKSS